MTTLPPLPESEYGLAFWDEGGMHAIEGAAYTADQMRTYGAACAAAERERAAKYRAALVWALGAGEDFALRPEGRGQFWWRSELAERAGLFWNGECYLDRPQESK